MNEWNIQSRSHHCQECGKPFADGDPCHTLLFEDKALYDRQDVCGGCWESQHGQGATSRKGFVSHWQCVYKTPPAKPDPIRKETAETLLRKLVELNQPEHKAARFILAVMLERKRILKVKAQSFRDGERIYIYEHAGDADVFAIADPNLQLDQLAQVQQDVARLIEAGVEPQPPPAPALDTPSSERNSEAAPASLSTDANAPQQGVATVPARA